jgi:hypothetical protein
MSHRNDKRKAAIWILENICVPPKMIVTAIEEPGKRIEFNQKKYDWFKLKEFISKSPYDKNLLRDACDLLRIKEHIDILDNEIDRFDIQVKAFKEGEVALREDFYQDDIDNYLSDKRFRNLRWQLPLLIVILTAINIGYTFYKDGKSTSELKDVKQEVNTLRKQLEEIKSNNMGVLKRIDEHLTDTTAHNHANNGQ